MQLSFKEHFQLIVFLKLLDLKTVEVLYEKAYMSLRPPSKDLTTSRMDKRIAFEGEAARQPEGEVVRQIKFFQPTQPTPNPIRDRLGRLDNMKDGRNTSFSQEINVNSVIEELRFSDGTERPAVLEDKMDKNHKDPDTIELNAPRHAQYLHNAWKRHQDAVYCVDINLAIEKGLNFFQTRLNAMIFQEKLPAYCIPKVVRVDTGEVLYEKNICDLGRHQRSPWNPSGKEKWFQNKPNDQLLGSYLEVSNRTNQF